MTGSKRLVVLMLICAGVTIGTGHGVHGASLEDKMKTSGKVKILAKSVWVKSVDVTIRGVLAPEDMWRQLQRYQTHLAQEPGRPNLAIDCSTPFPVVIDEATHTITDEGISCEQLAAAKKSTAYKKLIEVNRLTYTVLMSDWDKDLEVAFNNARTKANAEEADEAPAGHTPDIVVIDTKDVEITSQPACIPPYKSPCYYRPQCLSLGKCSQVSTGCAVCSLP